MHPPSPTPTTEANPTPSSEQAVWRIYQETSPGDKPFWQVPFAESGNVGAERILGTAMQLGHLALRVPGFMRGLKAQYEADMADPRYDQPVRRLLANRNLRSTLRRKVGLDDTRFYAERMIQAPAAAELGVSNIATDGQYEEAAAEPTVTTTLEQGRVKVLPRVERMEMAALIAPPAVLGRSEAPHMAPGGQAQSADDIRGQRRQERWAEIHETLDALRAPSSGTVRAVEQLPPAVSKLPEEAQDSTARISLPPNPSEAARQLLGLLASLSDEAPRVASDEIPSDHQLGRRAQLWRDIEDTLSALRASTPEHPAK